MKNEGLMQLRFRDSLIGHITYLFGYIIKVN
jgi:hypothetical protein